MIRLPQRGPGVRELDLPLPPERMPLVRGGRPLKRWRYVGVYGSELMLCVGRARIGPLRQEFWAVAEPDAPVRERTSIRAAGVTFDGSRAAVRATDVRIDVELADEAGVESVNASGRTGYVWTRKHAGVPARAEVTIDGSTRVVEAEAAIDETAGYHARRTQWRWSAGVGRTEAGERVGWNLVSGVNDGARDSERAIWVDGEPFEPGPVEFAPDLSRVAFEEGGELRFSEWSAREDRTNLLLLRSEYRQPFGTFAGELPGGLRLSEGYGVMEWHEARW